MSEFIWKKKEVTVEEAPYPEKLRRVLLLYTGGTVGMKWNDATGYNPAPDYMETKVRSYPMLCDPSYTISESERVELEPFRPIALPLTFHRYRILYCVHEYKPLLDSSNMSMEDWAHIARDISAHYATFNAFVVLHGTDTMCYTASALSFMLENLGKSVVLSGSQVPLSELRNDGRDNLLGALVVAGQYEIPEVTIFFHNKLYRGNRCTKMNSASLEPFQSPNLPPLASVSIDISVEWDAIQRPMRLEQFRVQSQMNSNVGILRIFPGITAATIRSFLQPPMCGVVLQTFGAGNIPDTRLDVLDELRKACERGVVIVNCSQCARGHVTDNYAAGRKLRETGVVPGADMTTEAALTKLSYLLGQDMAVDKIREDMCVNLCGELTVIEAQQQRFSLRDSKFLQAVASSLHVSSAKEIKMVRHALYPPLMCAAAANGDTDALIMLHEQGGDFNIPDYDGRTPLHLASTEGHLETSKYLLCNGASVHAKDRFNNTPLHDAIRFKRYDIIQLLIQTGAHISVSSCEMSAKLYQASCEGDADALRAWRMAGAEINPSETDAGPLEAFWPQLLQREEKKKTGTDSVRNGHSGNLSNGGSDSDGMGHSGSLSNGASRGSGMQYNGGSNGVAYSGDRNSGATDLDAN